MMTFISLHSQTAIQELTIDFDDSDQGIVSVLTGDGDCDANPGIFGIMDGAFVINDMEGVTCCTNSPLQGMNDNRALLGPVIALSSYCDVSIMIDVSLSATAFESCLSRDINPIGCTAFIPTFDPGGDGFQLETMFNGVTILSSGYCGQQRRGSFTANIGDIEIGDVFTFLITGGTQDEDEKYSINSIQFVGRQRSFVPAMITTADTVLCEGLDPLILTEISGGSAYQWRKDGNVLASNTFSYNSGGVASPTDEGLYSVRVTDAGGCITEDQINIVVVSLASKQVQPTFSNLQLTYCIGDTVVLPTLSDEGVRGNWSIEQPFIINNINALDSIEFSPDDILYTPVSFSIIIQDYIMVTYKDTLCVGASLILGGEIFDSSRLEGSYVMDGGMNSCDTLYTISLSLAKVDSTIFNQTVCPGDTFNIGGELFHVGRLTGGVLVLDVNQCFTFVDVALSIGTIETTIEFDPCIDNPIFEGISLRNDTSYTVEGSGLECDSIINIIYQPTSIRDSFLTFLICPDDSVIFNNNVFDFESPNDTFIIYNAMGCPMDLIISLDFIDEIIVPYEVNSICMGDTIQVEDEFFYFGKQNGLVRNTGDGCDTLFQVDLTVNQDMEETITVDPCSGGSSFRGYIISQDTSIRAFGFGMQCDTIFNVIYNPSLLPDSLLQLTLCEQDSLLLEGVLYHASNTSGTFEIVEENQCRRSVLVSVQIESETVDFLRDTICAGADVIVGGQLFNVNNPNGRVVYRDESRCDSIVIVELEIIVPVEQELEVRICDGDTITVQGMALYTGVEITEPIVFGPNGCDTVLMLLPIFLTNANSTIERTFCSEEMLIVGGEVFDITRPSGLVVIPLDNGCDSLIEVRLQYLSSDTIEVFRQLCQGQNIQVGGEIFNAERTSGQVVIPSENGCDSLIDISLEFFRNDTIQIVRQFCNDQSIEVGGEIFNADRTSGQVIIPLDNGCDSILEVHLNYSNNDTIEFFRQLCDGQTIVVGGVTYDSNNPSGFETMSSQSGCDSVVNIDLSFGSMFNTQLELLVCQTEEIFVGTQFYSASNLSGTELFISSGGCDSIVEVSVMVDTVDVDIKSNGTCRQSRAGSIEVTVLSQDTFEISLAGVTFANPATSVIFDDLTIGEYSVVVESARGCFFVFPTEIEATFANDVSYTITDGGSDFYNVSVNISGPFQDIIWEPSSDLSCIDCLTPTIRKGGQGEYRAIVQDLNGCISVVEILIEEESQVFIYIPNVVSTNGAPDNRSFYLRSSEEGVLNYDMSIYDRWGQLMFDSEQIIPNDRSAGWQGFKNGSKVSSGVYVYRILIRLEDGVEESRFGEILVIN